jgi:hypothetical protein
MVDEETRNEGTEEEVESDELTEGDSAQTTFNPEAEEEADLPASAKNMPGPSTRLAVPPRREIGALTVSLIHKEDVPLSLEEVRAINNDPQSESRTPLMTLIQALLADRGGSMSLGELTEKVVDNWNRPFPTSPYTKEELVYVIANTSDELRIY